MNIYTYVAECNPAMAKAICHKYGYKLSNVQSKKDLGICLEQLVAKEGEAALDDIVKNHPDKDLIIEMNQSETKFGMDGMIASTKRGCGCGHDKSKYDNFVNYIGEEAQMRNASSINQTNTIIIASAFLLGAAILAKKL